MKVKVKITCPYCGHNQHIDQDSTIFYGTIKKLTECPAVKCGLSYVYDLDMEITVVAWAIEGQTFLRDNKKLPAMDPKVLEYLEPANASPAAIPKKGPADHKKPAAVKLEPVKLKLKKPGPQDPKPLDHMAVLDWISLNNYRANYARGFITSDIYRYCKLTRNAARAKVALDRLEKLGHVVRIPEKMQSCRGNENGSFGYRLSFNTARKANEIIKEGNTRPGRTKPATRPGFGNQANYIQSTPKE